MSPRSSDLAYQYLLGHVYVRNWASQYGKLSLVVHGEQEVCAVFRSPSFVRPTVPTYKFRTYPAQVLGIIIIAWPTALFTPNSFDYTLSEVDVENTVRGSDENKKHVFIVKATLAFYLGTV